MIIDFHTHTFPEKISLKAVEKLSGTGHIRYYTEASETALRASMKKAGVDYSVNLPVVMKPEQTAHINDGVIASLEEKRTAGIIAFGGLHPEFADCRTELRRLREHGVKGIKLHPAFQDADINDIRYKRIIGAASEEGLVTVIHAGPDVSFPDHNFASVAMLQELIEDVRPEKFVLAHMGGWHDWETVQRELAGAPVWLDTAFSLGKLEPKVGHEALMPYRSNLSEEEFVTFVRKHGTDHILFATDSPWADQSEYVAFVRRCTLTEEEQTAILGGNAERLLGGI